MFYQNDYSNFLLNLDKQKHKTIYARITTLTIDEFPIECIEGRITQGSINIDGASAVRRTCSLTMVAQEYDYSNYTWGLNTKFKLEVGIKNEIDFNYPDIIWFPQGIYVLTSINTSKSINNFSISIQGKDKMCLLNGEVGGTLESTVDFGIIEEENSKGEWVTRKITIPEIIRHAVHTYGGEPYHNIIINDLSDYGLELLEYRYDIPMYMYRKADQIQYSNILLESDCLKLYDKNNRELTLDQLTAIDHLESLTDTFVPENKNNKLLYTEQNQKGQAWCFTKVQYGQTAGYRLTDLTFAGDLIANIGESLTSVLDKIRNMLTEFEYFYNLQGQFVFQKKQSFVSTMWNSTNIMDTTTQYNSLSQTTAYTFTNHNSVISFNNNPNLLNMRNDYTIWGERTSVSGATIPIHLRYAIDNKVIRYKQILVNQNDVDPYNEKYGTLLEPQLTPKTYIASTGKYRTSGDSIYCDWREILYQMANDYYKYNFLDDFELRIAEANMDLYPNGQTGYEQYYTDIQGFWRQLFYPNINEKIDNLMQQVSYSKNIISTYETILNDQVNNLGIKSPGLITDISALAKLINDYEIASSTDKVLQWPLIKSKIDKSGTNNDLIDKYPTQLSQYRGTIPDVNNQDNNGLKIVKNILQDLQTYFKNTQALLASETLILENLIDELNHVQSNADNFYPSTHDNAHWCKDVFEAPEALNFWFDFLDQNGELDNFNVKVVGSRPKAINDTLVKSIYFRETPPVIFQEPKQKIDNLSGYKTIQIDNIETMFSISAQGKSAKDKLDELLYIHGYCIESATINTIPIYYLEPNVRIHINDTDTKLNGDYIVSKITLPLTYNGTMSITASKVIERLL